MTVEIRGSLIFYFVQSQQQYFPDSPSIVSRRSFSADGWQDDQHVTQWLQVNRKTTVLVLLTASFSHRTMKRMVFNCKRSVCERNDCQENWFV